MRSISTKNAPVSAFAAAGACPVLLASRVRAAVPAAASPLAARLLPMTRHDQAQKLIMTIGGYETPVQETTPSVKLGGFRGVPPRSRPV